MTRFLIGLSGFALGVVAGLVVAGLMAADSSELPEKTTDSRAATQQEPAAADVESDRRRERDRETTAIATGNGSAVSRSVSNTEPFAPVIETLSPGSPLYRFARDFRDGGLWREQSPWAMTWLQIGKGAFQATFDATRVGPGKINVIARPDYCRNTRRVWRVDIQFRPSETLSDEADCLKAFEHLTRVVLFAAEHFGLSPKETERLLGFVCWFPVVPHRPGSTPKIYAACLKNAPLEIQNRFHRAMAIRRENRTRRTIMRVDVFTEHPQIGAELGDTHAVEISFCPLFDTWDNVRRGDVDSGWFTITLLRGLDNGDTSTQSSLEMSGCEEYYWPRLTVEQLDKALAEPSPPSPRSPW